MEETSPQPIEEHPPFRDWAAFVKLRKDVGELADKRAVDAQKLSAEFSKLIIVNLQFINAGGLLAVPTLQTTLLGLDHATGSDKFRYLGLPMLLYASGLILASLCSFFTYKNYSAVAAFWEAERHRLQVDVENVHPRLDPARKLNTSNEMQKFQKQMADANVGIRVNYIYAQAAGWCSMVCFIGACVFLAAVVR